MRQNLTERSRRSQATSPVGKTHGEAEVINWRENHEFVMRLGRTGRQKLPVLDKKTEVDQRQPQAEGRLKPAARTSTTGAHNLQNTCAGARRGERWGVQ